MNAHTCFALVIQMGHDQRGGPERSSTTFHFIQMWWHAIPSSTFVLKTVTTPRNVTTQI